MSGYFKFAAIYRARTLSGPDFKIIVDPVTIESFQGSRSFLIPKQISRLHVAGENDQVATTETLSLPESERFFSLTARSKEITPSDIITLEDQLDRVVTHLSISVQPHLFFEQIYRGPIFDNQEKWWASMHIRPGARTQVDEERIHELLMSSNNILRNNPELDRRYTLMSRFYARSIQFDPSEEKFLLLWTCLEIFPMCNTSKIAPLVSHLSNIVSKPTDEVKKQLKLGLLNGIRSKLVHDGALKTDDRHLLFMQLELIVHAILRSMCHLPYDNSLDQYFEESK